VRTGTDRVQQLINYILKRVILRLNTKPVIPCEAVADDKAAQDVVRAEYTHYAQGEEGERHSKSQEGFVINQAISGQCRQSPQGGRYSLVFLGETQNFACCIADHSPDDTRE
jgi:hypothetical protein